MKKYLVGVIGVVGLGVVLVGSYIGMGILTERAIKQTLQNLKVTKGLLIQVRQYHRGWFHSDAVLSWTIPALPPVVSPGLQASSAETKGTHVIPVTLSITHGPLMIGAHGIRAGLGCAKGQLVLPEGYRAYLNKWMDAGITFPVLNLRLWFTFFNHTKLYANVPAFHWISQAQQFKLDWLGVTGRSVLALDLSEMEGDLKSRGFQLNRANAELTVGKFANDYSLHTTPLGLYVGTVNASLKSLQLLMNKRIQWGVKDLTLATTVEIQDNLLEGSSKFALASMTLDGQSYGPGHLIATVQRVDAVVMAQIRQRVQAMKDLDMLAKQKGFLTLLPDFVHLLEKGAVFSIPTFNLKTPQGLMEGNIVLAMPDEKLNSPLQIFSKLHGTGHLHLSEALLRSVVADAIRQRLEHVTLLPSVAELEHPSTLPVGQALEEQIQSLTTKRMTTFIETGLFVKKGADYYLDASLENAKLAVNGKIFSPAMLAF